MQAWQVRRVLTMVSKARGYNSLLIMIEKRRFFILLLIKKCRIQLASLPAGFYAFPIIFFNMSSAKWTLLNSTEISCDFLFSICLLLSLCSLLLLSCFLLGRILSDSLWLDRSANFCLMLLTYFLFCGFIVEPAIHSHNLRAKKKGRNDICWLSDDYALYAKSWWCGKWGKYVKTFLKSWGM